MISVTGLLLGEGWADSHFYGARAWYEGKITQTVEYYRKSYLIVSEQSKKSLKDNSHTEGGLWYKYEAPANSQ